MSDYKTEGPYRVDVLAAGERAWATNALRFDSEEEGLAYAHDLWGRWMGASKMRVVASSHPDREPYERGSEHPDWS